ncbi:MAG: FAD-dependent oxidoreductase [Candidatus Falkowbacteria bacterium]
MDQFDLLIVGAGPAGLTAAIYALRYNMRVGIIAGIPGGLMMEAHKISNWPGEKEIAGYELSQKMKDHAESFGAKFIYELAAGIAKLDNGWQVTTSTGAKYQAPTLLYSLGTEHRHLDIPAEAKFKGKGVSYCATCDAMFYKGKNTGVVGSGNSAMTAALYLAELCPKVYIFNRSNAWKGEVAWQLEVDKRPNIIKVMETNIVDMAGDEHLAGVVLDKEYNGSKEVALEGLFVEIGLLPKTEMFKALGGEVDEWNYIKVGPDMSTNLPGLFAAGDTTNASNRFRQIVTAAAEGSIAADGAFNYFQKHK